MKFNINNIYTFSNFKTKCIYNDSLFIDGDKYLLKLYQDNTMITDTHKEICIVLHEASLKLDYIGIKEEFRGGILKALHNNCYNVLKKSNIENIILKPLSSVLTMWIYFGFNFIRPIEAIRARLTLVNYLKSKSVIEEQEIVKYDEMLLKDIVILHKEIFKQSDFPKVIEKELYYTNLTKDAR